MSTKRVNAEYIEDRSIESASDDSFRHEDVLDELAELALRGPAPSNIALFAPWGTGKSGIAKLLKPRIEEAKQRFVYFDAFKHRTCEARPIYARFGDRFVVLAIAAKKKGFDRAVVEASERLKRHR